MNRYPFQNKPAVLAWCIYDWANSAFSAVILTFVFSVYFTEKIALTPMLGTAQWGRMVATSGLIIALLSPILGAISDYQNQRKPWIFIFTWFSIIATALLWFATPNSTATTFTLVLVAIGLTSMEIAMVFYNAMLKSLSSPEYIGRISGWGWGLGYIGGLLCLTIALFIFVEGKFTWLNTTDTHLEHIRICGPLVATWFAVFSIPLFIYTHEPQKKTYTVQAAIRHGLHELYQTLRSLKHHKQIALFLVAHLLYIDGLNTIFAFGGIYAANTFHMTVAEVIKLGIAMNIAAGIGAIGFAWLDDFWGSKATILTALALMILTGVGLLLIESKTFFWFLGIGLSLCVGPTQAASRSLMTRLVPKKTATQMFGIYALSGKITTFLGPWLLAWATLHFSSQRIGMSTAIYFLIAGGLLLSAVKSQKD